MSDLNPDSVMKLSITRFGATGFTTRSKIQIRARSLLRAMHKMGTNSFSQMALLGNSYFDSPEMPGRAFETRIRIDKVDDRDPVIEDYEMICKAIGIEMEKDKSPDYDMGF